jgi:two-component system sensor histidine kinase AtoS
MEAMIRRSDRLIAMGEMAASIAHEIRNPLTGIKMLAQNVMDELTEPNSEIVNLATMQINEVKRLDRIITEMLQFARPSEPSIKQQNLHEIIDSVLYLLEEKAKEMGIKFCKYYQARQQVSCDEAQFKQLLFNILINAMDASPQQGEITVTTKNNQSQTQIFIKDNGSGIPDAILGKIFNPFFTTKEKGTGLGLSIAHRIMTEHGGTISYVSSKDKGTTATITLEEN